MLAKRIDGALFRAAMARFPGPVSIITAVAGNERRGITATAVCSVSAEPPHLLACLNRKTGTCAAIRDCGMFNINLLQGPKSPLALRFAGADGVTGEEKFHMGHWRKDARGLPVLDEALVVLCCDVNEAVDSGSHTVFIGTVVEAAVGDGEALIYENQKFHRLAPW